MKLYIREKLKILNQLGVVITESDREHFKELKNENDIDRYAHSLIMNSQGSTIQPVTNRKVEKNIINIPNKIFNTNEATELMGVSRNTLNKWIKNGMLECEPIHNNYRKGGRQINAKAILSFYDKYPKYLELANIK